MSWKAIYKKDVIRVPTRYFSDIKRLKQMIDANGFVAVSDGFGHTTFTQYLKFGRDCGNGKKDLDFPPYCDHICFLKKRDEKVYYIASPYNIDEEAIKQWAKDRGMNVVIYDNSYYSNDAFFVVISLYDDFVL